MRRIKIRTECLNCEANEKDPCKNAVIEEECTSAILILFQEKDGYAEEKVIDLDADPREVVVALFRYLLHIALDRKSGIVVSGDMPFPPPFPTDQNLKPTPIPEDFREFLKEIGFDIENL